jgi:hypothetical protein
MLSVDGDRDDPGSRRGLADSRERVRGLMAKRGMLNWLAVRRGGVEVAKPREDRCGKW